MGVQIYLLEQRMVNLLVGNMQQKIGTLRRSWKVTEIDGERAEEIELAKTNLLGKPAPLAVMVADVSELPLAEKPDREIACHLVLGWDVDRSSVNDFGWDYLPVLGYAVRQGETSTYALHEQKHGLLHAMSSESAFQLGICDQTGRLFRQGQPTITECRSVRNYITSYAEADCVLSNGQAAEILTEIKSRELPASLWYIGKRPLDVRQFPAGG